MALTDAAGAAVERYAYDAYGGTYTSNAGGMVLAASAFGNPFGFTGQRYDPAVRLYHFWARTYSPDRGRWNQRDPLGYVDGANALQYVSSAPLWYRDPLGLAGLPDLGSGLPDFPPDEGGNPPDFDFGSPCRNDDYDWIAQDKSMGNTRKRRVAYERELRQNETKEEDYDPNLEKEKPTPPPLIENKDKTEHAADRQAQKEGEEAADTTQRATRYPAESWPPQAWGGYPYDGWPGWGWGLGVPGVNPVIVPIGPGAPVGVVGGVPVLAP